MGILLVHGDFRGFYTGSARIGGNCDDFANAYRSKVGCKSPFLTAGSTRQADHAVGVAQYSSWLAWQHMPFGWKEEIAE
jgi:hypothetical protein